MKGCEEKCPVYGWTLCCQDCPEREGCGEACGQGNPGECPNLTGPETAPGTLEARVRPLMRKLRELVGQKKALEAREKELKERLKALMEESGQRRLELEALRAIYVAATVASSLDAGKVKIGYPDVYARCLKEARREAYVKVEPAAAE